jgi:bifunctional oligoribonuclease and PAP phosphatase NrnA
VSSPSDIDAVVAALQNHERFLVVSHENPDGDALGSLLAMQLMLDALGKDSVMLLAGDAPLPVEYRFLDLERRGLLRERPPDHDTRVLVAVDCAQESRMGDPELLGAAPTTINVDHHHDNSRFGDLNLVVAEASSTGELLAEVAGRLGVTLDPDLAEALYTAIVTDTGRFQYQNTTPHTLRLAADLVEAGADSHKVFQVVYESVQFAKLKLLARALERARVLEGGRVVVSSLVRGDFAAAGAAEPYSEGIIDFLRAVEGAELAVLVREPPRGDGPLRKASLRSALDELDVSVIARRFGGGGHRQAAGFSSDLEIDEITRVVLEGYADQRDGSSAHDAT